MKINKLKSFLGIYSKILLFIFSITILFNILFLFLNPSLACYERIEESKQIKIEGYDYFYISNNINTSCTKVSAEEYNKIRDSIKRIGVISIISLFGYIIVFFIERKKYPKNDIVQKILDGGKEK